MATNSVRFCKAVRFCKVSFPSSARFGSSPFTRALLAATTVLFLGGTLGCEEGGVGDPCIPEDEFNAGFPGFSKDEVFIESRSFQCRTRVCLVANFQGRVSCKYGQSAEGGVCRTPDLTNPVTPAVPAQLIERRPEDAVYCTCRCAGAQADAPYCECPDGFQCQEMLADVGLGDSQIAGSYCVRNGKYVEDPAGIPETPCTGTECGDPNDFY